MSCGAEYFHRLADRYEALAAGQDRETLASGAAQFLQWAVLAGLAGGTPRYSVL